MVVRDLESAGADLRATGSAGRASGTGDRICAVGRADFRDDALPASSSG
jgi:hypothetical protein